MATKKFQTFIRPLGSSDVAEGKIVLEDFDVETLRKSMNDIIRHAKKALKEMDREIPSTTKVCIWKSHTNLTHPGKYFRPSKVKIMRPTSPK